MPSTYTYTTLDPGQLALANELWLPVTDNNVNPRVTRKVSIASLALASIAIDNAMSDVSTNPVQNAVVKAYIDSLPSQTVDNAMSASSANPVENQVIKAYVDSSITTVATQSVVQPGDEVVVGSGVTATDAAALAAAVAALNSAGYGTLWIVGEVLIDATYMFTAPISVRGLSQDAAFRITAATAGLAWGSYFDVRETAGTNYDISATSAFASKFTCTTNSFGEGEIVALWSDDAISNIYPHYTGGIQKPMEIHQIFQPGDAANQYEIGDFVVDALTTTPKVRTIPILTKPNSNNRSDVYIADFAMRQNSGIYDNLFGDVRCLNGVTVKNIRYELGNNAGGPGYWLFNNCMDVTVTECSCDGVESHDNSGGAYGYLFIACLVNGFKMHGNKFRRTSHHFTTSAGSTDAGALTRWGTCRNVVVSNNIVSSEGYTGAGRVAFDCHPEGWGIVFENNIIATSGLRSSWAFSTRARHTVIRDNTIVGSSGAKAVEIRASDCMIINNTMRNMWRGVVITNIGGIWDRITIDNNTFIDPLTGTSADIISQGGDYHKITRNTFADRTSSCIDIRTGDYITVANNTFADCGGYDALSIVLFSGTTTDSSQHCLVANNTFERCSNICVEFAGSYTENRTIGNTFIESSSGTSLIKYVGGSAHRVANNDCGKDANTYSVDCGGCDEYELALVGNNFDGYGTNSLGLTGSNATAITNYHNNKNIFDRSTTTYSPSNVTTDRSFDADTVAVAELADVVGTLIADLQARGALP